MMDPSLEWMIDKDNPPKDNLSDVKMTSPSDPKTVRFVSPPSTAQLTYSTTYSKNDDMLMTNTDIMDNLSLMGWTPDNDDPPNDKENSPKVRKPSISISYANIQKVEDLINNDDSTTTPSASLIPSTSTKSRRNVLEQRKKRRHRKEREKKSKRC